MRRRATLQAVLALVSLAAAGAVAAPALAKTSSFLVYTCVAPGDDRFDDELCRVDADGRNKRRLTDDARGDSPDYLRPTLTADSRQLVFVREGDGVFIAAPDASNQRRIASGNVIDAAVSPAGDRVAFVEVEPGSLTRVLFTANADGSNRRQVGPDLNHPTWLGDELLAVPGNGLESGPRLCAVDEASGACRRTVAERPGSEVSVSDVSGDGRLVLADTVAVDDSFTGDGIYSFLTTTGRPLRPLQYHSSPRDPAWGPTRAAYAYADLGGIYLRQPRLNGTGYPVVKTESVASSPVWGGSMGQRDPKLRITSLRVRGRTLTVRGTIARKARAHLRANFEALGGMASGRTYWRRASGGRFRFDHARSTYGCVVFVGYPGDETYGWASTSRSTTAGDC